MPSPTQKADCFFWVRNNISGLGTSKMPLKQKWFITQCGTQISQNLNFIKNQKNYCIFFVGRHCHAKDEFCKISIIPDRETIGKKTGQLPNQWPVKPNGGTAPTIFTSTYQFLIRDVSKEARWIQWGPQLMYHPEILLTRDTREMWNRKRSCEWTSVLFIGYGAGTLPI